jgi:hypothetical protein
MTQEYLRDNQQIHKKDGYESTWKKFPQFMLLPAAKRLTTV